MNGIENESEVQNCIDKYSYLPASSPKFDSNETVNIDTIRSNSIPTINIESAPSQRHLSVPTIGIEPVSDEHASNSIPFAEMAEEDKLEHGLSSQSGINETFLHENYTDRKLRSKSPVNNLKSKVSNFESESGGLAPECSKVRLQNLIRFGRDYY